MSHVATTWLADIDPKALTNGEFRVLFHLCDCHNPSYGCFPKQAYLVRVCGVSRSGLNKMLAGLESKRFIRREQQRDDINRRQLPTHYILGFEMKGPQEPGPKSGHGTGSPEGRAGSTPVDTARVHSERRAGSTPVDSKEPVIRTNTRGRVREAGKTDSGHDAAAHWAGCIRAGRHVPEAVLTKAIVAEIVSRGLLSEEELRKAGLKPPGSPSQAA